MGRFIIVAVLSALAQSPDAPAAATLSGVVLEAGSRDAIAGAEVTLIRVDGRPGAEPIPVRPRTATTDADGRYEFEDVDPGRYHVSVQQAGFAPIRIDGFPQITLTSAERRDGVEVLLQRGGAIAGRVIDDTGRPLANVRVVVARTAPLPANVRSPRPELLVPVGGAPPTNDLGEFRVFGLPPGEYYVQAVLTDGGRASATSLLPTYFPDSTDLDRAQQVAVDSGDTSDNLEIQMARAPAFRVSGVVIDESGRAVANAMVRLMPDDQSPTERLMLPRFRQVRTERTGRFTIDNVTNGTYTLLAIAPVVVSAPAADVDAGNVASLGLGIVGGTVSPAGVTTETSNGTTLEYRDETATRFPVTVDQANVTGLQLSLEATTR